MKKRLLFGGVTLLLLSALLAFYLRQNSSTIPILPDGTGKAMEQEFMMTKDPKLGYVPRERLFKALEFRNDKLAKMAASRAVPGITWQERGPGNIGGRTRTVWFDRSDAPLYRKVWAGGVNGGLWYTNDITLEPPVWHKVDDFFDNMSVSSFVQDPFNPQIMYFGTGEAFTSMGTEGGGIWKSTNGGATWNRLPSTHNFLFVQDLLIDNNGHLYAATAPRTSAMGSQGILKSTDGGTSWTITLLPNIVQRDAADLEMAPNGDIYASVGFVRGGRGSIYRSAFDIHGANTGSAGTWENITPNQSGVIPATQGNFWNRIELACAPSSADTVYALFVSYNGLDCSSIQRYQPSTNTWTVCTVPTLTEIDLRPFTKGQGYYDLTAAVDPNNAARLHVGGINNHYSSDGGMTWTRILAGFHLHDDQHAIQFAPNSSSRMIFGNDGGVAYSWNADAPSGPTVQFKSTGYNTVQYYSCAIHPTDPNFFLAGSQDNGSSKFLSPGINSIYSVTGGDGGHPHIDQNEPNIQITSYINNNYFVSIDGGSNFSRRDKNARGQFINPTDYDNNANILYGGDGNGAFWRWTNPAGNGPDQQVLVPEFNGQVVLTVFVSPQTANRVYFGLQNRIVRVDDAHSGANKTGTVVASNTAGNVSGIAIDPADENHIIFCISNYGAPHVFESTNALSADPTWTDVTGDLPDMPVRTIMFDPRNPDWAIIGTELGVWSTDNIDGANTNWSPTNGGLANVRVTMLQYRASDRTMAASTFGRGLFTAVLQTDGPLPVTLTDFKGRLQNNTVTLDWKTASEQNSKGFDIERSYDGSIFSKIGFVKSAGNSSSLRHYQFRDPNITMENNYYRLKQTDIDDRYEYSKVIVLKNPLSNQAPFRVLGNPVTDHIDLQFEPNSNISLQLLDVSGRVWLTWQSKKQEQVRARIELPAHIPKGTYVVHVKANGRFFSEKLIRQ